MLHGYDWIFLARRHTSPLTFMFFSVFLISVLKFHGVGTALMRKFALFFFQHGPFAFSDVSMTLRSFCESYSSDWSQDFGALP